MNTYSQKTSKNTDNSHLNKHSQKKNNEESAFQFVDNRPEAIAQRKLQNGINNQVTQRQVVIQRALDQDELDMWVDFDTLEDLEEALETSDYTRAEKGEIKKNWNVEKAKKDKQKKWDDVLATCVTATSCISWDFDNTRYHINLSTETYHVTKEASPKNHYFFKGTGKEIEDKQPTQKERGGDASTKGVFSELPEEIQEFIKANWDSLIKS
jgi:hypothetical protein